MTPASREWARELFDRSGRVDPDEFFALRLKHAGPVLQALQADIEAGYRERLLELEGRR